MKKLVILGTALLALNAVASEVQIKGGYDFYRKYKNGSNDLGNDFALKKGPTLGLEYIVDNQGEFEWGLGAEYKLSANSGKLKVKDTNTKVGRSAPVYALGKFNLITTNSGNDALYVLGRAGYNFAKESKQFNGDLKGGLYVAAGLGTEFGPVSLEAIYERSNVKYKTGNLRERDHIDSAGVRVGYRFGQLKNDRSPKIITQTVQVPVPTPVPAPAPEPAPIVKPNTATLPFSCSVEEKKCVIRGFKVDGRVPNENEAADLRTIAGVINQFADGGSIDFVGHTDSTGSNAYNQKLSVARAQNVARLLKDYGLKNSISYGAITGQGENNPADTNDTVQGRYNNRRVELFFQNVDFSNVRFINQ
ncbi:OmpA/MotB domain-containing protein [Leptotrichia trevisanii]|uniref:OmpA/MotB domain-containing protein n=1 Tax=Leptotrichia trevisanii TaxID=109328 RepID=A0A510KL99_9FUSO|nr:OmpA family protein [Leptotrichia trevisanii]BBM44281.1 OmpA/MotB domain-containing protein [Leptotrichia trevisanii]BBM51431.1 OmpA/MotB domain-containing protein [Leptotrichia trevisanii]BBM56338.1 OmpA/MotB domain-containing protein [Leptotrichia trevisanii]